MFSVSAWLQLLLNRLGLRQRHAARRRLAGLAGLDEVHDEDDGTRGDEQAGRDDADARATAAAGGRSGADHLLGSLRPRRAAGSNAASSASTSASRAESRATRTAWSSSERSPASCSRVRVVEGAVQEVALVGQVPALVVRGSVPSPPPPRDPSTVTRTVSSDRSASKARLRRQKTTPTPTSAPAPSDQRDDPDERDAAGVGRHQQDGLAVLGHEDLVDVGGRPPGATMLSIWCRTAMAVVAFDWATETSVHDGQRTPASMAAAR